jgi:hypothetical protein
LALGGGRTTPGVFLLSFFLSFFLFYFIFLILDLNFKIKLKKLGKNIYLYIYKKKKLSKLPTVYNITPHVKKVIK